MNTLQRAEAIKRLQRMIERYPEGSFDRVAIAQAIEDMLLQIPGQVKYGGGAWRCFQCGAAVQPRVNHCGHCGKRLEWPQAGEEPQELCKAVKAVADDAPSVDPEKLPIVQRLRAELARVTAERDALKMNPPVCVDSVVLDLAMQLAEMKAELDTARKLLAEHSGVDGCKTIKTCFGHPLDKVRQLVEADKEGRCVVFPCRPSGVTVYQLRNKKHALGGESIPGIYPARLSGTMAGTNWSTKGLIRAEMWILAKRGS